MDSPRLDLRSALVPIAAMLGSQVLISLAVLSLSVLMPAVARDLDIAPKLVGVFTAVIYVVASAVALGTKRISAPFNAEQRAPSG